jgi:hypothetical protein
MTASIRMSEFLEQLPKCCSYCQEHLCPYCKIRVSQDISRIVRCTKCTWRLDFDPFNDMQLGAAAVGEHYCFKNNLPEFEHLGQLLNQVMVMELRRAAICLERNRLHPNDF